MRLPDPRERPWLSVAEVAAITGEGEKAIRHTLDAGHLPVLRIGRYVRVPTAAFLTLVGIRTTPDSTTTEPPSPVVATTADPTETARANDFQQRSPANLRSA